MRQHEQSGESEGSSAKKEEKAEEKPKTTLELLEEDDEFEEFQGSWDDGKANEAEDELGGTTGTTTMARTAHGSAEDAHQSVREAGG